MLLLFFPIIPEHWSITDCWASCSSKTKTFPFYIRHEKNSINNLSNFRFIYLPKVIWGTEKLGLCLIYTQDDIWRIFFHNFFKKITEKPQELCCLFVLCVLQIDILGLILGLRLANERQCYFVMTSLIGWAASLESALYWKHKAIEYSRESLGNRFHIDGLVPERRNSSALAMELRLSCINPSNYLIRCSTVRFHLKPVRMGFKILKSFWILARALEAVVPAYLPNFSDGTTLNANLTPLRLSKI